MKKTKLNKSKIARRILIGIILVAYIFVLSQPILSRRTQKYINEYSDNEDSDFYFNNDSIDITIPSTDRGLSFYETSKLIDSYLGLIHKINNECYFVNTGVYTKCNTGRAEYQVKVRRNMNSITYSVKTGNLYIQLKINKGESITVEEKYYEDGVLGKTRVFAEYVYNDHMNSYSIGSDNKLYMYEYVDVESGKLFGYDLSGTMGHVTNYYDIDKQVNYYVVFYHANYGIDFTTIQYTNEYNNVEALVSIDKPMSIMKFQRVRWNLLHIDNADLIDESDITYFDGMPFYVKDIDLFGRTNEEDVLVFDIAGISSDFFTDEMMDTEIDYILNNYEAWCLEYGITVDSTNYDRYYFPETD